MELIAKRLADIASRDFGMPPISSLESDARKLSVMFTGFWNTRLGAIPAGWIITNYQRDFDMGPRAPDDECPARRFRVWRWHPGDANALRAFTHIERLGARKSVKSAEMEKLKSMLQSDRPIDAIIGRALNVMRRAAERTETVGREISVIVIPQDVSQEILFSAEHHRVSPSTFVPDIAVATSPERCRWISLSVDAQQGVFVPRVHRKALCPCGSGRTYERCHRLYRRDTGRIPPSLLVRVE